MNTKEQLQLVAGLISPGFLSEVGLCYETKITTRMTSVATPGEETRHKAFLEK